MNSQILGGDSTFHIHSKTACPWAGTCLSAAKRIKRRLSGCRGRKRQGSRAKARRSPFSGTANGNRKKKPCFGFFAVSLQPTPAESEPNGEARSVGVNVQSLCPCQKITTHLSRYFFIQAAGLVYHHRAKRSAYHQGRLAALVSHHASA